MENGANHAFIVSKELVDYFFVDKNRDAIILFKYLFDLCLLCFAISKNSGPSDPDRPHLTHPFPIHIEQLIVNNALARPRLPRPIRPLDHYQWQSEGYNYDSVLCRHFYLLKHVHRVVETVAGATALRNGVGFFERGVAVVSVVRDFRLVAVSLFFVFVHFF